MLTEYIAIAMKQATYELLEDNTYYGEIPVCGGVWSNHSTLEGCRDELQNTLEGWIILGLQKGHFLPVLDGIDLNLKEKVA
ncbi:type II toxin-antitoxin system HicB family antitoxin [Geminocystis sp. CENA526]|uniref:type II toxin-antitoxin system HicB family antitoxin n=1 Tax=Geminocystis sp. CENA526 TaxID=1355871 RepID=UPI003D6FA440